MYVKKVLYKLENDMVLEKGMVVRVTTDNTDFDEEYIGEIGFINEDAIEIDGEFMRWEYIVDVNRTVDIKVFE